AAERDPRKDAKKPLATTARAKRIYAVSLVLLLAVGLAAGFATDIALVWLMPVQLVPVALVAGTLLLMPSEARVQRRYWHEAHDTLMRFDPIVVAVTGSYGKTSVKHILGHVLETAAPTLITPGSVNTAMGIARIVRERLRPHHRYLVVEMGAYGIGSIARLCALTPPKLGIITAIGKAHYERFKTLDVVARAKFELAEAAHANDGTAIIASDTLQFDWPRRYIEAHRDMVVTVGPEADADLALRSLRCARRAVAASWSPPAWSSWARRTRRSTSASAASPPSTSMCCSRSRHSGSSRLPPPSPRPRRSARSCPARASPRRGNGSTTTSPAATSC